MRVEMLLLVLFLGTSAVSSAVSSHRATWINVWLNSNQKYVPDPISGRGSNNVTMAWDVACAKYKISLPANMTLANTAALDWVGGANYGNMFVYLGLIQHAGMDTVILDFTNGFGMANSKFPVEQLHRMLRTHYPAMHVAYAVSSSSFPPALAYLADASSDTFGYLMDQSNQPVVILYTGYKQYMQVKEEHPTLRVLFANGESTAANKAGWHKVPYSGYLSGGAGTYDANEVFWLAPSLDWQPGPGMNASWSISLPWLCWGLHTLDALASPPWLTVMGSFDDSAERNMWMPALTSWATSKQDANLRDNTMMDLDGVPDAGVASVASNDWTVFYDTVRAYFTNGILPRGQTSAVAVRVPTGVGEFMLGQTERAYTLYVNPPFPFNQGVGSSDQRPAFVRSVSSVYTPGLLFPSSPSQGSNNGSSSSTGSPLLEEFSFQTGLRTTRPVQPLHIMSCTQCGLAVCTEDFALSVLPGTYVTTSDTPVLPNDLPGVDYSSAVDVHDCDLLRGPGVAFVTGSAGVGIVAVPQTYATQALVYSVPQLDGRVILYAQATGEVFAATSDFEGVELRHVRGAERHMWTLAAHPASEGASVISIVDTRNETVAWEVDVGQAPGVCVHGSPTDCLYTIRLAPTKLISSQSAFVFRDTPQRTSSALLI